MTKQNKMLLGVGALVIAGYLVWTNRKKGFANAGGRTGTYTLPAGSRCPKPYLTIQGITPNAPVTCVPPKTMTITSPPVFVPTKEIFGTPVPTPPQIPSTTPIPNVPGTPPGTPGNPKGFI